MALKNCETNEQKARVARTFWSHQRFLDILEEGGDNKMKRSRMAVMQFSDEQAELLSKKQPDDSMSLSERLLIESAAEKDRISEPKVRKKVDYCYI